jgi:hypothetical protein
VMFEYGPRNGWRSEVSIHRSNFFSIDCTVVIFELIRLEIKVPTNTGIPSGGPRFETGKTCNTKRG